MSTYFSTSSAESKQKSSLKCQRYIIDPITNKIIANPNWTLEQESELKKATKIKCWNPTEKSLKRLARANLNKTLPVKFESEISFQQLLDTLRGYNKKSLKFKIIQKLHYSVMVLGHKSLHQSQTYIGNCFGKTREWANKQIAKLCKDGIFKKLYRHLFTCLYSMNNLLFDLNLRYELCEFFPWMFHMYNKLEIEKFTEQIRIKNENIFKLDNLGFINKETTLKEEIQDKNNNSQQEIRNLLSKLIPVLCLDTQCLDTQCLDTKCP